MVFFEIKEMPLPDTEYTTTNRSEPMREKVPIMLCQQHT